MPICVLVPLFSAVSLRCTFADMQATLSFLQDLSQNNNREWFQSNKDRYEVSHLKMVAFTEALITEMGQYDVLVPRSARQSLFRIYRDVRFSKDKSPYKNHWGGFLRRAGADRRGGFYFQVGPEESYVMGGFFAPNAQDLLHIRNQLAMDADPLRDVMASEDFKKMFGELKGEQLKTAPRGFDKDQENIDLIRFKKFLVRHDFTVEEVADANFPSTVASAFAAMLPFFQVMTDYLTTDFNGESLL
jgi:uncharacterized protein (TIGR02453 family)